MALTSIVLSESYIDLSLTVRTKFKLHNIGTDIVETISATSAPNDIAEGILIRPGEHLDVFIDTLEFFYAKAYKDTFSALLAVETITKTDFDLSFETSNRGDTALGVWIQDQTSESLELPFLSQRSAATLANATTIDSRFLDLEPGHNAAIGDVLELSSTSTFIQAEVLGIVTNTIELDQPVNAIYEITDIVKLASKEMIVDGSVTPVIFSIIPLPGQFGDMVRIILDIRGPTDMDFSTFGSDDSLSIGCLLRVKKLDGTFKNLTHWKDNGEFINSAFDHAFLTPKQGNLTHALAVRSTFGGQSKRGVVIRLDGFLGEELQVLIQDNLLVGTNSRLRLIAEGHEVQT